MEKIRKFVECLLPITICNLKCHYCYVIQRNNRLMKKAVFRYSVDKMVSSLTKERMGGVTFFSICGAGEWSYVLNLENGILQACYGSLSWQNIFENNKPIALRAIGRHCGSLFCMNSSHFLSMGTVPSLKTPTYCELRDRKTNDGHWYNDIMRESLSHKLEENNIKHGIFKRVKNEFSFIKESLKLSFNKIGRK